MAEPKILTITQAYSNFWTKYFVFSGTARRSEFWWTFLVNMSIGFIIGMINVRLMGAHQAGPHLLAAVFLLVTIIPSISQLARRCHDAGFSAWWLMALLIPIVDALVLLYIAMVPTDTFRPNKFRR